MMVRAWGGCKKGGGGFRHGQIPDSGVERRDAWMDISQ